MSDPQAPSTRLGARFFAGLALLLAATVGTFVAVRSSGAPTAVVAADAAVDVPVASSAARALVAAVCPEVVTPDDRGDPRNARGHIRYCWRGQAKCRCDRDDDCYALEGYRPCVPAARDAGTPRDLGSPTRDAGTPRDLGSPTRDVAAARDAGPPRDAGQVVTPPVADASAPTLPPASGLRAFPGAEGWGAVASGGRGGRVIYVTNLNASGAGSFQDAVAQSGPRYVLFKVSGVIHSDVQIRSGDLTIAGQTSPGGITVRGLHTTEEPYCDQQCGPAARGVENFVIRHLRSRPAGGEFPDGLRLRYARRGVVDHVSIGNASDECVEVSYANNVTIQDSLLAETIGGHAYLGGMLVNYTNPPAGYQLDNLALLRNGWIRLQGRYPEFSRESAGVAAGTVLHAEIDGNLFWDLRYFENFEATDESGDDQGRPIFYQVNRRGNWTVSLPGVRFGQVWMRVKGAPGPMGAYFNDNRSNLWPTMSDWDLNYCCNDLATDSRGSRPSWARSEPFGPPAFPAVSVLASSQVAAYVAANAGAFPRDAMDRRLLADVVAGRIDPRPSDSNPAGDALAGAFSGSPPAAPLDTDGDGMPDAWERARGLNPAAQDHNGTSLSADGYANLEVYLNELAAQRVAGR